ncbi:uncharacterized protein RMCC_3360 [Mycolicibacterium canariasense]|uniref:Uncharacterized protein n=1 Tax=Mycolicibacterium canariasense TaxID=228230 RepID=A0A117IAI9_MYCCR|nr:hypothetical protein [Mycolicibacterium canariasense]MCV7209925.1 hypothetical protein [Mycolicibacterium canariasense]ORV05196.1 hypothetical protein AWB94_20645 [Mycolicibacterium canariasense]GAS96394.1 uncharacterized protein RMCC_3360 [Mycolicibacterium canariasense]
MGLIPMPKAELTDEDVTSALGRAVGLIDLILDVLAEADPLGLRPRLHCADVPGTAAWDAKDRAARVRWWVRRVGALDTLLVAFPGVLGAVADRLPIQDLLGFTNQAIVLCAVAREHGITDTPTRVRMLAAVLCGRDVRPQSGDEPDPTPAQEPGWAQMSLVRKVWQLAGILGAVAAELGKRPRPRGLFHYLGMLPWLGAVADYLGEYGALVRAAEAAERWIVSHTDVTASPAGQ